jgi:hypothetical protein
MLVNSIANRCFSGKTSRYFCILNSSERSCRGSTEILRWTSYITAFYDNWVINLKNSEIAICLLHACTTNCLNIRQFVRQYAYLPGALLSSFFRHDCGVNISCRPHVLQADLFLKIHSSIWLSQNFLDYISIPWFLKLFWWRHILDL